MKEPNPEYGKSLPDGVTIFYVDRAQEDKIFVDGWPFWYDTTVKEYTAFTPIQSPSGNSSSGNAPTKLTIDDIITPNGDSLSNYSILYIETQLYAGFSSLVWANPGWAYASGANSYGMKSYIRGISEINSVTGSFRIGERSSITGGGHDLTADIGSAPSRIKIVCYK